jgi:hypothetical protein
LPAKDKWEVYKQELKEGFTPNNGEVQHICLTCTKFSMTHFLNYKTPCSDRKRMVKEGYCTSWIGGNPHE